MKIALIWPNANAPWPPKGWGAIEKYVWEYKINLEKLGHLAELRYSNSDDLLNFDIVQVHTWNQALNLSKRNIPYIFSFDDSHVIYFGRESDLYKNNIEAIKKSILSIMHGEFLIDYFGEDNMVYLAHGANPDVFKYLDIPHYEHKLLCVGRTDQDDRKGILISIKVAMELNLPITIVGPNEDFFREHHQNYDKLTIIGNSDDDELVKIYNEHTIFLHPSKLETGHPNLTLTESIYCGTPVVGTCDIDLLGMKNIKLSEENLIKGIKDVINNYEDYQYQCFELKNSKKYDWYTITEELINNIYKKIIN